MRAVGIAGIGHTKFGRLDYDLVDIMAWSSLEALKDAGIEGGIDQVFVANMGAGAINNQTGIASALVSRIFLEPAMAETIENGPASGASAVKCGYLAIAAGMADTVLVTGGERMRETTGWKATDFVATLTHPDAEYPYGLTLPAYGGMFTRAYMERHGLTEKHLAMIAVKAHQNAEKNPFAHIEETASIDGIYDGPHREVVNPVMADPLRLYDLCPVSDGAASVVLTAMDTAGRFKKRPIRIAGIGQATDTHCVFNRDDLLDLKAVRLAAERAYAMAGIGPKEISFAELHDAFLILEVAESEEVGFFPKGGAKKAIERGETEIGGRIPINTSGGLKAKGHPVGATGVSQIHEIVKQLRGEAEEGRRVKNPRYGLAVNFGGFGNNVVATILAKE
ncbi:MAG: acetyl-CoA acetyltransferase [Candidatus Eisenbacteria bacterium]|nr:acetyl-CoA acetyltransferase [Candidatus Eisenbacteria bacterium]